MVALDEILSLLADYVESKNSKLFKKYETTAQVEIDKRRFYQALLQIAKNACEAMPGGGNIYIVVHEANGVVKIELKSSGRNIPEDLHAKIFEPFFSYEKEGSAGIGLSIAQKIINDHGGKIDIESDFEATKFIISIPVAG